MLGVGATALIALIQGLFREQGAWRLPTEPLRSVCQLIITLSVMYPIAGLVDMSAESPHPGILYFSLSGVATAILILHLMVLWHQRKVNENIVRIANANGDEAREKLVQLQAATDIETVYDRLSDPTLVDSLARDLNQSNTVRVVAIGHGSLDDMSALWKVITGFATGGRKLRVISDAPLRSSAPAVDYRRVPEVVAGLMRGVFAIDCGGAFYFGIGSVQDDLVVARFDGRSSGKNSLASGVFLLTNQLSRLLESGLDHAVSVRAATSPSDYKEMILGLESEAVHIDRLPKRLFVIFKSPAIVRAIAEQRYGPGSVHVGHYVEEHEERAARFFAALGRGMICREIYNKAELISYVRERRHSRNVTLTSAHIEETIVRWRDAVLTQPNYLVGLTDAPLPFKYELVDGKHFIMHEAIGQSDEGRLNAFCISGSEFCKKAMNDFEIIWNNIPPESRKPKNVAKWIESTLRPLIAH